ncbi:MAG: glutamine-hydrolyzing GMP synthase [Spirochaetes bacterium]|nr:MAG: glutamine-hydrolyzing GMP synthase [Spirochaetota bacterium]
MDKVLILDFGSQTTQLISRRIRDLGVFSEVIPGDVSAGDLSLEDVRGLVFSGSPYSVYQEGAPLPDPGIYELGLPLLGICYGLHCIIRHYGGEVKCLEHKEYGRAPIYSCKKTIILEDVPDGFISWMSHGDSIVKIPKDFFVFARSERCPAVVGNREKKIYGLQFHPEVTHCEYGEKILSNFVFAICGARREWNLDSYINDTMIKIKRKAGKRKVLSLVSGGVDSTVTAGLLLKALPADRIHLLYIDTGLMRKGESGEVKKNLLALGAKNLYLVDSSRRFLEALKGISEPEKKRNTIGDLFIKVQEEEVKKRRLEDAMLAQGTLYTDLIESGKGVGQKATIIKSHHNVRSPLVEKKREEGSIIEPLEILYKDEVRRLGLKLGISREIIERHPFPGPGLAVRIPGEDTEEKCQILKEADAILIGELKRRGFYNQIWQAFCVLLPVRSVGVAGDIRKYGWVLAIRAVNSIDGMTASVFPFPMEQLVEIASLITNAVPQVGRVVYDISTKPPSTIEWE